MQSPTKRLYDVAGSMQNFDEFEAQKDIYLFTQPPQRKTNN